MNLLTLPYVINSVLKGNITVCSISRACLHGGVQQSVLHTNTYCQVLPVHWHLHVLARLNCVIIRFRVTRWHDAVKHLQNSILKTLWCSPADMIKLELQIESLTAKVHMLYCSSYTDWWGLFIKIKVNPEEQEEKSHSSLFLLFSFAFFHL